MGCAKSVNNFPQVVDKSVYSSVFAKNISVLPVDNFFVKMVIHTEYIVEDDQY